MKTFAQLKATPPQFETKTVEVPELEMSLFIHKLSGLDHKRLRKAQQEKTANDAELVEAELAALLISIAVTDSEGAHPEEDLVIEWPVGVILKLGMEINDFNSLSAEAKADTEKN